MKYSVKLTNDDSGMWRWQVLTHGGVVIASSPEAYSDRDEANYRGQNWAYEQERQESS